MRIIAGKAKGRKIAALRGGKTRPTLQIVRKSIFDIIGEKVKGARILDLFAGIGSLGLEALSRDAREVTFVEINRGVFNKLRENVEILGFKERSKLAFEDAEKILRRLQGEGEKYDIVFADPPYETNVVSNMVKTFEVCDVLESEGFLIIEHSKHTDLPVKIGKLNLWKVKEFGDTRVSFYRKQKESS